MSAPRLFFRSLRKRPGFAGIVILTLALGIGANTALFSIVHAVLIAPLPFQNPARIMILSEHSRSMDTGLVSPITFDDWAHRNEVFSDLAAFRHWENRTIEIGRSEPEPILHVTATSNYFRVLGFSPLFGRTHGEEKSGGVNEAVLSYELWTRRFNARHDALGETIRISGASYVVVGVMPPAPHDIGIGWGDVWTPIHWYNMQHNRATSYRARYLRVLGRLKPGITVAQAQDRMTALQRQLENEATSVAKGYSVRVEPLENAFVGRFRPALFVLLGAVGFVLLTACANVANLMLARGIAQEKEIAIRIALGAGRVRLTRDLLWESVFLSATGALLGLALARWGLWLLKYSLAAKIPRLAEAGLRGEVLTFTLAITALSAILFSLAPILGLGRDIHGTFKEAGRTGSGGIRRQQLRTILVGAEFAFATLLLVAAGLLVKSFTNLLSVHPGFEFDNRIAADVVLPASEYKNDARRVAFFRELFRRLHDASGITSSGGALYFPCRSKLWLATVWREGVSVPRGEEPVVYYNLYAGDYFRAMGIPLIRGRLPTERELWEPSNVSVINETMARQLFSGVDPIGRRFKSGEDGQWTTIVGIVGDVRQKSLDEPAKPEFYEPFSRMPMPFLTIAVETPSAANALAAIQAAASAIDPALFRTTLRR